VRTSQEAADHLGVTVGQIAKSVIFKRLSTNGSDGAPMVDVVQVA
jgi:prolyl-tRNA editing enzyme YbaK/EbsC (Cys-tRNA(Pro) deacylase)